MIATSIEQSKHLIELGLNPTSADMHYYVYPKEDRAGLYVGYVPHDALDYVKRDIYDYIPAWSMSALLELMPDFEFWTTSEKKYSITCGLEQSEEFDNAFDAVYDLMVNLLENKVI